jgi:hypothetical protein
MAVKTNVRKPTGAILLTKHIFYSGKFVEKHGDRLKSAFSFRFNGNQQYTTGHMDTKCGIET